MDIHDHLRALLREGMANTGLSQNKLARLANMPQANLSAILNGKHASEATWKKLLDVTYPEGVS